MRRLIYGAAYLTAGIMHFTREEGFRKIIPPFLPFRKAAVLITGVIEIFFGIALLVKRPSTGLKKVIQWFLWAVFPANVYMAVKNIDLNGKQLPKPALWGRLPLQWLLVKEMDKL